jgi:macrophage erythroblast attacher
MEMAIDTPSPLPAPAPSAAGRQTRATEAVRLEHQLVCVPLEALRSTVRVNHRHAEKEIAAVLSSASSTPAENSAAAVDHLTSLVSRLHGLKRKALPPILPSPLLVSPNRAVLGKDLSFSVHQFLIYGFY